MCISPNYANKWINKTLGLKVIELFGLFPLSKKISDI